MECLTNLIGVGNEISSCFDNSPSEDVSASGYYMIGGDEYALPGIFLKQKLDYAKLYLVRDRSVTQTVRDLITVLSTTHRKRYRPYSGIVGQEKSTGFKIVSKQYVGIEMKARASKSAKLVITAIWIGFSEQRNYPVSVTSNNPTFTPVDVALTSGSGSFSKNLLGTPIELPLYSNVYKDLRYMISVERGSAYPLNNKLTCCNNTMQFSDVMEISGGEGSSQSLDGDSNYAHGIIIEGYVTCQELGWICDLAEIGEYSFRDVFARTAQFKAVIMLISDLLRSASPNSLAETMSENLTQHANRLSELYDNNLQWIANNLPESADCYTCNESSFFHLKNIYV